MTEFVRSAALPHLEARRSCQEITCYRAHTHDAFSIGLIDEGTSVFAGSLGGSVRLEPGDVIVIPADQVHRCNPDDGSWRYQMIHMDQDWASAQATTQSATELFAGIAVLRRPDLHHQAAGWVGSVFSGATVRSVESGLRELLDVLGAATPEHSVASNDDPELLDRLAPVLQRLGEDETNPSLDELAQIVGLTKYQLVRAVKRATGLAPLAWRQNARVRRARRLLRAGHPIVDTAHELGFTDQSHFHRVFRAHVAAAPGGYRV